jgi:SAM-dependent methyltransferase
MVDPVENREQASLWELWASAWIDADAWTATVGASFGAAAIDALDPQPGARIADVGCGTGPTTIEIARRVAPAGRAIGFDIAPSMVASARERAQRAGLDGVKFRVADAQVHRLDDDAFDGAFSQFGVMFFQDPVAAFANIGRSLRDGGRLAFTCWQGLFLNEWMFVPGAAALGAAGVAPSPPAPGEPGPFSLSEPAVVTRVLTAAGFDDVTVSPMSSTVEVPEDRLDEAAAASCGVGVARQVLDATADPVQQDAIRAAVRDALAGMVTDGRLLLGAAAHIVTASYRATGDRPAS